MLSIFSKTAWPVYAILAAWLVVGTGSEAAFAELPSTDVPVLAEVRSQSQGKVSPLSLPNDSRSDLFRQAPTLSGRLRVSEQTLIPYIGAGFGGGYVTERDRALSPQPVLPQQNLFGESMGKGMMPNEFQMGIRIPF